MAIVVWTPTEDRRRIVSINWTPREVQPGNTKISRD
jgi:hypothetical protein